MTEKGKKVRVTSAVGGAGSMDKGEGKNQPQKIRGGGSLSKRESPEKTGKSAGK